MIDDLKKQCLGHIQDSCICEHEGLWWHEKDLSKLKLDSILGRKVQDKRGAPTPAEELLLYEVFLEKQNKVYFKNVNYNNSFKFQNRPNTQ